MANKLSLYTFEDVQYDDFFFSELYPKLKKYCYFLSQSKWDGDDLAQEAVLKAITYYHKDKITTALLNKIARNQWVDTLRKRKREELRNDHKCEESYFPTGGIMDSVDLLMDYFTPKQAIIYILKEAFQYQSNEIAEIFNTTEIAVKSRLNRARKRLENQRESQSLDSFWKEEEREQLWNLFQDSLINQDPTDLIEAIPSILDTTEVSSAASRMSIPFKASAPLSTLCMAA
ncbi:sigma factor-like helix-turn-helix DNA-binding protein [Bacillus sp. OK048]|uniref:sigma factor-like helix-turn-helix DNA-binding protein n=1 Tax=Bacillus sp. OK048 TaxID=1882761 RepID=UPI000891B330|nr:sigma factor-like helix-turn-helix DNA-binding protein [Bacillus sp. OK048]SDM40329.1 RNA polymerase sigma-70 factor, ECF subfamily [Bacillus sp. OK048]